MTEQLRTNLPAPVTTDSAEKTRKFFDEYYDEGVNFASGDIDATVGFFRSKGFDESAAISVSAVLLREAKKENLKVFELIDALKNLDELQLNNTVRDVLNYNRLGISVLGAKTDRIRENEYELRNILL
jgi:hypothetical protein